MAKRKNKVTNGVITFQMSLLVLVSFLFGVTLGYFYSDRSFQNRLQATKRALQIARVDLRMAEQDNSELNNTIDSLRVKIRTDSLIITDAVKELNKSITREEVYLSRIDSLKRVIYSFEQELSVERINTEECWQQQWVRDSIYEANLSERNRLLQKAELEYTHNLDSLKKGIAALEGVLNAYDEAAAFPDIGGFFSKLLWDRKNRPTQKKGTGGTEIYPSTIVPKQETIDSLRRVKDFRCYIAIFFLLLAKGGIIFFCRQRFG